MVFKTHLQFSLPITIQQVNEYSATETKILEAFTSICKMLPSIDNKSFILAWYLKVKDSLPTKDHWFHEDGRENYFSSSTSTSKMYAS